MKWLSLIIVIICASCKDVSEPAYISIEAISLQNSAQGENSTSSSIKDAWVYINDNLEGAFEIPCKIPVSNSGTHKISIGGGIWVNSVPTLRSPYVFYNFYTLDAQLEPGKTLILNPVVRYSENIKIAFQAGFDSATGNTLEASSQSDTTAGITNKPELVYEGPGSFQAILRRDEGFIEFQQTEPVVLPKSGAYVFLELDYISSHRLELGIRSFYPAAGNVYTRVSSLPPTESWQKVYINLTSAVSTEVNSQSQRAVFSVRKLSGSGDVDLRMDNIRIVHFKP